MDAAIVIATLGVIYMTFMAKQGAVALDRCLKSNSTKVEIPLKCNNSQMIHVIRESYSKENSERKCLIKSNSCNKALNTDTEGLVVNCNGKTKCNEDLSAPSNCKPLAAYEIDFECVAGSIDICITVNTSLYGFIYLHSPGFPDSVGVNGSCHCEVTGSLMKVTVLELRAGQGVVTLSTDKTTWSSNSIHYNRDIAQLAESALFSYDNHNRNYVNVWMKVSDTGTMNVTCWKEKRNDSLTTADNGPISASSPGTHHHTTSLVFTKTGNPDGLNASSTIVMVAAVCGVVIFLLAITNVALLVYFKIIKPARNKLSKKEQANITEINDEHAPYEDVTHSNTDEQRSRDTSNTYNDLSRYENTDGTHEYGKIHVYNDVQ